MLFRSPDHNELPPAFEASTDLSHLEETLRYLPIQFPDRFIHLFSRLSPYFDSGVLLYLQEPALEYSESWAPGAVFAQGQYVPLTQAHLQNRLKLPALELFELKHSSPYALLRQLQLEEISDSTDARAFAFKAHPDFLFLVFSKLPEPWLRTHVENIFKIITRDLNNL